MGLKLTMKLPFKDADQEVYLKIVNWKASGGKEDYEDGQGLVEHTNTRLLLEIYNSQEEREAGLSPMHKMKVGLKEGITSLADAYTKLKLVDGYTEAIDC